MQILIASCKVGNHSVPKFGFLYPSCSIEKDKSPSCVTKEYYLPLSEKLQKFPISTFQAIISMS